MALPGPLVIVSTEFSYGVIDASVPVRRILIALPQNSEVSFDIDTKCLYPKLTLTIEDDDTLA